MQFTKEQKEAVIDCEVGEVRGMTKAQFMQCRAEIENKPKWDNAPEWAEAVCFCPTAESWYWVEDFYGVQPADDTPIWYGCEFEWSNKGYCFGDWRYSLEKRPADQSLTNKNNTQDSEKHSGYPSKKEQDAMVEEIDYPINPQAVQRSMDTDDVGSSELEPPTWNGEGLPTFGVVCEGYITDAAGNWNWVKVEVLKRYNIECAVVWADKGLLRWCDQFRLIKTQEDISREKIISDAMVLISEKHTGDSTEFQDILRSLYDADMLKMPGEKY